MKDCQNLDLEANQLQPRYRPSFLDRHSGDSLLECLEMTMPYATLDDANCYHSDCLNHSAMPYFSAELKIVDSMIDVRFVGS